MGPGWASGGRARSGRRSRELQVRTRSRRSSRLVWESGPPGLESSGSRELKVMGVLVVVQAQGTTKSDPASPADQVAAISVEIQTLETPFMAEFCFCVSCCSPLIPRLLTLPPDRQAGARRVRGRAGGRPEVGRQAGMRPAGRRSGGRRPRGGRLLSDGPIGARIGQFRLTPRP